MATLRGPEGTQKYQEYVKALAPDAPCSLCEKESLKTFKHWKVVENLFPYDKIASKHHMLVPLRHVREDELTAEEMAEIKSIKENFINSEYDWIIEATPKNKSISEHFHIHLIVAKS